MSRRLFMQDPQTGRRVLATAKREGRFNLRCSGGREGVPPHDPVKLEWRETADPAVDLLTCPVCELVALRRNVHPGAVLADPARRRRVEAILRSRGNDTRASGGG